MYGGTSECNAIRCPVPLTFGKESRPTRCSWARHGVSDDGAHSRRSRTDLFALPVAEIARKRFVLMEFQPSRPQNRRFEAGFHLLAQALCRRAGHEVLEDGPRHGRLLHQKIRRIRAGTRANARAVHYGLVRDGSCRSCLRCSRGMSAHLSVTRDGESRNT
jgi:hypothetical protein